MGATKIILLDLSGRMANAWARNSHLLKITPTSLSLQDSSSNKIAFSPSIHQGTIDSLDDSTTVDCIVSPGNSFGYLGGGFDLAVAEFFKPSSSPWEVSETALQLCLQESLQGYNPPSNPKLIDMRHAYDLYNKYSLPKNKSNSKFAKYPDSVNYDVDCPAWIHYKCRYLLHLPTMRWPQVLGYPEEQLRQIIFDYVWNILTTIHSHNLNIKDSKSHNPSILHTNITNVILTGLGTGVGQVDPDLCAISMLSAIEVFNYSLNIDLQDELQYTKYIEKLITFMKDGNLAQFR